MRTPKNFFENEFIEKISQDPAFMSSAGVRGQNVSLNISGSEGGQWTFQFDNQGKLIMKPGLDADAVCTIESNDKTFGGVLSGSVNVPFAVMMRKIKIKGDLGIAAKVGLALKNSFS